MYIEQLSPRIDLRPYLEFIGVDGSGIKILSEKSKLYFFKIKNLHVGAANILKQDALSIGADLAVPKGTVVAKDPFVDVILIANARQLKILLTKEKAQPFGLKLLAQELENFITNQQIQAIQVMGIINVNEDSFYEKSRVKSKETLLQAIKMLEDGANILDIGGVSSRPGSVAITQEEEFSRIKESIDLLYSEKLHEKTHLSLDSYSPKVIHYALERGFKIVNDITGLANDEVAKLCGEYDAMAIIMHMQGKPETMQINPQYNAVLEEIDIFFNERIEKAMKFGIKSLALDVGIGFGKNLEENLLLVQHQQHFRHFGFPLLIGASRKSLINELSKSTSEERLPGTLAIHLKAIEEGASIVRVHDVKEHVQAIKIWKALNKGLISE